VQGGVDVDRIGIKGLAKDKYCFLVFVSCSVDKFDVSREVKIA